MIGKVEDGKIVPSDSAVSLAKEKSKKNNSTVDKDQFLQLLVAQMKYQDPLEPTSNTEYVSQYATFSELEQMQNMSASLELARASSLVGQTVLMDVTDGEGRTTTVQGNVDYVRYEGNKAFLSINGELYSMDDLNTVADQKYLSAYATAVDFLNAYNKLPVPALLTIDDEEAVKKVNEMYQNMSEYEKKFITDDYVKGLKKLVDRMEELKLADEENKKSEAEKGENVDKTEGTDKTEDGEDTDEDNDSDGDAKTVQ
ncbi:MAG: flagellar hook capping protein [Lachnospiraceae bacterium]|nr:flagellar hook capping protein [Lachnospiraceae bacterium]